MIILFLLQQILPFFQVMSLNSLFLNSFKFRVAQLNVNHQTKLSAVFQEMTFKSL
jgi:hypothetical protein